MAYETDGTRKLQVLLRLVPAATTSLLSLLIVAIPVAVGTFWALHDKRRERERRSR